MTSRQQALRSVLSLRSCWFRPSVSNLPRQFHLRGMMEEKAEFWHFDEQVNQWLDGLAKGEIPFIEKNYQLIPYYTQDIKALAKSIGRISHKLYRLEGEELDRHFEATVLLWRTYRDDWNKLMEVSTRRE
jgi:hypothetical protein